MTGTRAVLGLCVVGGLLAAGDSSASVIDPNFIEVTHRFVANEITGIAWAPEARAGCS